MISRDKTPEVGNPREGLSQASTPLPEVTLKDKVIAVVGRETWVEELCIRPVISVDVIKELESFFSDLKIKEVPQIEGIYKKLSALERVLKKNIGSDVDGVEIIGGGLAYYLPTINKELVTFLQGFNAEQIQECLEHLTTFAEALNRKRTSPSKLAPRLSRMIPGSKEVRFVFTMNEALESTGKIADTTSAPEERLNKLQVQLKLK